MQYDAGIDVSLEQSSVCVVDAAGKIVKEAKVVPSELVLELSLARSPVRVRLSDQVATSSG
jgi:hypothetical protein